MMVSALGATVQRGPTAEMVGWVDLDLGVFPQLVDRLLLIKVMEHVKY